MSLTGYEVNILTLLKMILPSTGTRMKRLTTESRRVSKKGSSMINFGWSLGLEGKEASYLASTTRSEIKKWRV
jgi:hypothetical protein